MTSNLMNNLQGQQQILHQLKETPTGKSLPSPWQNHLGNFLQAGQQLVQQLQPHMPEWLEQRRCQIRKSRASLLNMTTEITYAEVKFINKAQASGTPSEAPAAPKEKTCPPQSNSGCLKLLLAALLMLLLLTISFLIAFIIFFQKYSKLFQEGEIAQDLTHTMLECKKENLTMKGKSWSCCPKNWKPFDSNCYFFSTEIKNWADSKKNCTGMQAHLLVVDSKEEQDFINKNVNNNNNYYLGLSYLKNGHWEWVNETPYNQSVTFWHPGEPNFDYEHCAVLNFRQQWGWNDIPCDQRQYSISTNIASTQGDTHWELPPSPGQNHLGSLLQAGPQLVQQLQPQTLVWLEQRRSQMRSRAPCASQDERQE
ncbi:LOW QUALITY PROTEIN: C-type lectin domain family 4 member A-like [Sorex araneus]|uniref:LOW QUALITY PROTEIN: C-type lectin domain family 4 member A-like n=1 Tax=Sorex araneus TaxID=42254 RepID=UPI002433EFF9|nr:LOW QUALITY PROTEIN: C-type lectin domain family 4 member A-like [Sorex araneus]